MVLRDDLLDADALLERLEERIAPLLHQRLDVPDDELVLVDDVIADIVATLGTDPVIEFEHDGSRLAYYRPAQLANAAGDALFSALDQEDDEDGDLEQAARSREFARVACEAALSGDASPELMERLIDSDVIEFELDPGYDDVCDAAGNVELMEAAVARPARPRFQACDIRLRPRRVRMLRRARPRDGARHRAGRRAPGLSD